MNTNNLTRSNIVFIKNTQRLFKKFYDIKKTAVNNYGKEISDLLSFVGDYESVDINNTNITNNTKNIYKQEINQINNQSTQLYHKFSFLQGDYVLFILDNNPILSNNQSHISSGALITITDIVSTIAMSAYDSIHRYNISSKLTMQFFEPIIENKLILTCSGISFHNNTTAVCLSEIYNFNCELLASSQHVKAYLENTWKI